MAQFLSWSTMQEFSVEGGLMKTGTLNRCSNWYKQDNSSYAKVYYNDSGIPMEFSYNGNKFYNVNMTDIYYAVVEMNKKIREICNSSDKRFDQIKRELRADDAIGWAIIDENGKLVVRPYMYGHFGVDFKYLVKNELDAVLQALSENLDIPVHAIYVESSPRMKVNMGWVYKSPVKGEYNIYIGDIIEHSK